MTTPFESLFGILPANIQENVLLLPFIPKGFLKSLGLEKLSKGRLYASANISGTTVIQTGMGTPLVGDAVLYLKETNCRNIFLLGSCGALRSTEDLNIGTGVLPEKCMAFESFSEFLLEENKPKLFYPNSKLMEAFSQFAKNLNLLRVTCATVSSLKLEEDRHDRLLKEGIDVVDMECSAFFSAASYSGLSALAFFFVSDIVKERPFYEELYFTIPEKFLQCSVDFLCQIA